MKKSFLSSRIMWAVLTLFTGMVVSCSDDEGGEGSVPTSLQAPEIVQSEETLNSPITLAFSWMAVDDAVEYSYRLTKSDDQQLIAEGTTGELSVEIVYSNKVDLLYDTQYTFTVQAVAGNVQSEVSTATVTTSEPAIVLTLENLTYRSALMKCQPSNNDMLYQFAQIPIEKYTAYDSDQAFIEGYDYGYYKAYAQSISGFEWYQVMEALSKKGSQEYETHILSPETDYLFYAYGVEFDHYSVVDPVHVITPLIKVPFTTPAWEATSDCTFEVEILDQEVIEADGETVTTTVVSPTVKVTPSDENVRYYVAILEQSRLADYGNDVLNLAFNMILADEQDNGGSSDWSKSELLKSGTQTMTGLELKYAVLPGEASMVLVFGLSDDGLITTEIERVDFQAITQNTTGTVERKVCQLRTLQAPKSTPENNVDRVW